MVYSRVRSGAVVFNKVNGRKYLIEEKDGNKVAVQVLPDDSEEIPERIVVTEGNCIAFRCIQDGEPSSADGYTVEDGILKKDGEPVTEQGEIVIDEILYRCPGKLFLLADSPFKGNKDILLYKLDRDKFEKQCSVSGEKMEIVRKKDVAVYAFSEVTHVEGEEEAYDKLEQCRIIQFRFGEMFLRDIHVVPYGGTLAKSKNDVSGTVLLYAEKIADDNGVLQNRDEKFTVLLNNATDYEELVDIEEPEAYYSDEYLLIKGKEKFLVPGYETIAAKVPERYKYVVDVTKKVHVTVISIADDDYNIVTVEVTKTKDRGKIVKVSEN